MLIHVLVFNSSAGIYECVQSFLTAKYSHWATEYRNEPTLSDFHFSPGGRYSSHCPRMTLASRSVHENVPLIRKLSWFALTLRFFRPRFRIMWAYRAARQWVACLGYISFGTGFWVGPTSMRINWNWSHKKSMSMLRWLSAPDAKLKDTIIRVSCSLWIHGSLYLMIKRAIAVYMDSYFFHFLGMSTGLWDQLVGIRQDLYKECLEGYCGFVVQETGCQ